MTISKRHSDAGRLSKQSQLKAKIEEYCQPYRPKIMEKRIENGYTIKIIEPAYHDGGTVYNRVN